MADESLSENSTLTTIARPLQFNYADALLIRFLVVRNTQFAELVRLREDGWKRAEGDKHFEHQRARADTSTGTPNARIFFNVMCQIGDELHQATKALIPPIEDNNPVQVLDICMAPGGYSASALKCNPHAKAYGISLPVSAGGHEVLLPRKRLNIEYLDVTMLATEFGITVIPATHPSPESFILSRPFLGYQFDIVFCDGQVLRTHERPEYREKLEPGRLTVSQLILALQRISTGGTLIMLLHKVERFRTSKLLYLFSKFANIQLWKSSKKHATRSSFYMIARDVKPESGAAKEAVEGWKRQWWRATFGGEDGTGEVEDSVGEAEVEGLLEDFGEKLFDLGREIWLIQSTALKRAPWMR